VIFISRWDKNDKTEYYSEQVEIVFSAIYTSTNQLGSMASVVQGRDVTKHLVEIVSIISDILWNYFFSEVRTDKLNIVASVNLCIVARIAEVYDDRGRVEAEPVCANSRGIHGKCSCDICTGTRCAPSIVSCWTKDP
jgi:hypothetical protein